MSKLLVLGAGASHGHGNRSDARPPLAKGFFSSSAMERLGDDYAPLIAYLEEERDAVKSLGLLG